MPKIGDGTGMSGGGSEEEGLTSNNDAKPNANQAPYGAGDSGKGGELDPGGNETTPYKG